MDIFTDSRSTNFLQLSAIICYLFVQYIQYCRGTGTDSAVPTNTIQVPITTSTVTDSSSEYTGFISVIGRYIPRTGEL